MKNKKIVLAGGTGFIGRSIAKSFADDMKSSFYQDKINIHQIMLLKILNLPMSVEKM
jgi:nucleoside-diphosphate-sugar epimerase